MNEFSGVFAGSVSEEEGGERESEGEVEGGGKGEDEEEEEWQSLQETMKIQQQKKKELGVNKESHPVHAPFFPEVCGHMACTMDHVSVT